MRYTYTSICYQVSSQKEPWYYTRGDDTVHAMISRIFEFSEISQFCVSGDFYARFLYLTLFLSNCCIIILSKFLCSKQIQIVVIQWLMFQEVLKREQLKQPNFHLYKYLFQFWLILEHLQLLRVIFSIMKTFPDVCQFKHNEL